MFTNRMSNLIVAAVLVVVVALAVQQAFATKAIAPDTNSPYVQPKEEALRESQLGERYGVLPQHAEWSAEQILREYILGERYGVTPPQYARNKSYRSPLDECFDVPLREAASCGNASQVLIPSYQSPLDECFDVSISELASCRNASQVPAP